MRMADVWGRRRHLSERQLVRIWLDGDCRPHLQSCSTCATRYEALAAALGNMRKGAVGEADAYFTAERLAAQRQQVLQRVADAERPARVVAFPVRARGAVPGARPARSWLAGAAAAGLLIGMVAGQLVPADRPFWRGGRTAVVEYRPSAGDLAFTAVEPGSNGYEAFLLEIDMAVGGPRVPELQAIDAFTPQVSEMVATVR